MDKYETELEKLNGKMNKNDLYVGYRLVDGCYNKCQGYEFSKDILKQSANNEGEMFKKFDTTQKEFWDKILSLDKDELEIYFDALREFCSYIGQD